MANDSNWVQMCVAVGRTWVRLVPQASFESGFEDGADEETIKDEDHLGNVTAAVRIE